MIVVKGNVSENKILISKKQFSDFKKMICYVNKVSAEKKSYCLNETIEVDCSNLVVEVYKVDKVYRQFF